ncbi:MAG: autotransporter assembly complex family protein [Pseudomonadota bacterium]
MRFFAGVIPGAIVGLLLSACSDSPETDGVAFERPATAVTYSAEIEGLPTPEMEAKAIAALAVFRQQEDGANSLAFLKRRAQDDVAALKKLLRSEGHYAGDVEIDVAGEAEAATVIFMVDPGPAFTLERHEIIAEAGSVPLPAAELGSPVGKAARAEAIVNAEIAAVDRLQRTGYPYAKRQKRRAVADLEAATLEVSSPIAAGPEAVFGDIRIAGLDRVRERYLLTYLPWEAGEVFDLSKLAAFQRAILGTDLFQTVSVKPPAEPSGADGPVSLPVLVEVAERPFRTVAAGARFSTDIGPTVTGSVEHRNIWGENETLTVEAELGVQIQTLGVGYREPQYLRSGQDLTGGLVLQRSEDDAFDELSATATLGLQRRLGPRWVVGAGILLEASQITDDGQDATSYLFGIPLLAEYDSSDDKLNPTEGERLRLELTPFAGSFDDEFSGFLVADAVGSAYYDFFGDHYFILAGRARVASILTDELETVPQTRRLYSGGGGSVRGFAQRFIGPLDALNDPIGGLSALELGTELRARVWGDLGGTLFVEAGSVSTESFPDFENDVQVAAGVGLRYFSPAGPIRVDVALPLNRRDADDRFQIYFSIGQAF